jgi:hypothetical protein
MLNEDVILGRLGDLLEELGQAMDARDRLGVSFKSWEAMKSMEYQGQGMSVAASEKAVRALPAWAEMALEVENAETRVHLLNQKMKLGEKHWETWRSKYAAEKRIVK